MTLAGSMFPPPAGLAHARISTGLAQQERDRQKALRRLARLREKAEAEIDRLLAFLDASDPYVMTELEQEDDREDGGDDEPSLGFPDASPGEGASVLGMGWDAYNVDAELDMSDREPWLGWTVDGVLGGHRDLEEQCDDEGVTV